MDAMSILQLLGGIGLFLFGMDLMGKYLTKLAGSSLELILERFTSGKNRGIAYLKGWSLGTAVTAVIQSSAATTIMLIGFVNAGIMKLMQAIPVMMGANVGSTVTAQILRLGDLKGAAAIFQFLKPAAFAPVLVGVGAFVQLFSKKKKVKNVTGILIGLGLLFYGMTMMEEVFEPLRESQAFQRLFVSFRSPAIGILTGALITAVIQSSSASVGILQALSATGVVTYETAIPIIIGQNIGKCMTILLGSIGAGKKAKRVSVSYLLFNLTGAALFTALIYSLHAAVGFTWMENTVNRGNIANLHLAFNLLTSMLLLPFTQQITALTGRIVGREKIDPAEELFARLDERLLGTPTVALNQCLALMQEMCRRIRENYQGSAALLKEFRSEILEKLEENEAFIDRCETVLSSYIIKINRRRLSSDQLRLVSELLNSIGDFERIGDYSISMAFTAREMQENHITFSEDGIREIGVLTSAAGFVIETLEQAFLTDNNRLAVRIEPLSDVMNVLTDLVKARHIKRLSEGQCSVDAGVHLYDLLNCFGRISGHSANIALHIVGRAGRADKFDDMHGHAIEKSSEEYKTLYRYYEEQYIVPLAMSSVRDAGKDESTDSRDDNA